MCGIWKDLLHLKTLQMRVNTIFKPYIHVLYLLFFSVFKLSVFVLFIYLFIFGFILSFVVSVVNSVKST